MPRKPRCKSSSEKRIRGLAWWHLALFILPLVLLAGLGIHGLQSGREMALEKAKKAARNSGIWAQTRELHTFALDGYGSFIPSILIPNPHSEAGMLWAKANTLSGDQAREAFEEILKKYEGYREAYTYSGLPIQPLAHWKLLLLETDSASIVRRAKQLWWSALKFNPSVLTPELMRNSEAHLKEMPNGDALLKELHSEFFMDHIWVYWRNIEQASRVYLANKSNIEASYSPSDPDALIRQGKPSGFWVNFEGEQWWVFPVELGKNDRRYSPSLVSKSYLESMANIAAKKIKPSLPDYADLNIKAGEVSLFEKPSSGQELASGPYASSGSIDCIVVLSSPTKLYAQQRTQTLWLGALLACAFLAELAAFWFIQRALRRETELGEMKSNFVSSVSHELRAPIASMRLMAENLESGAVSDPQRAGEYHRLMAEECRRLSALIDNVLDFARIEQDRKSYHFAESDIAALIQDAVQLMQPTATQRKQKVVTEIESIEPPVCDSLAIRQALINLLDNAIKFTPEVTAITVRLRQASSGGWELSVNDQGAGIPAEERERIFDRFYRVGDELRRETQGAGIGLSIVKHIVEAHGGSVKVESQAGSTTFILKLPQIPPELPKA